MDRVQSTIDIIKALNKFRSNGMSSSAFIKEVCTFYDNIKTETISKADEQFLEYLANQSGIPHYFNMLQNYQNRSMEPNEINLSALSSIVSDSFYTLDDGIKIHRYQKEIYDLFDSGESFKRYFLSASTSFGKTYLVYEIIKKMNYQNVLLIFPTIALLSENLERLKENSQFSYFKETFEIHTLSDAIEQFPEHNIFLFTPERYLSFIEKNPGRISFDFCFVDEVYKIDNDFIIDEEVRENDRDVAYRLAVHEIFENNPSIDCLLVGPYITIPNSDQSSSSFNRFLQKYNINTIDKNSIEIVNKHRLVLPNSIRPIEFKGLNFSFESGISKSDKMISVLKEINSKGENSIIYCYSKSSVESYSKELVSDGSFSHDYTEYSDFVSHIESKFRSEWVVPVALKKGIGIHHGVVPKYIQKEIINLFNSNQLKFLFSTTTITEGVNTTAKNMVVMHHKKGKKKLKQFDAKNIEGRAGRFYSHYSGRVIILDRKFDEIISEIGETIKHKNFDETIRKSDVDLDFTSTEYLNQPEINRKAELAQLVIDRGIPENIISSFRSISKADKILIYDRIQAFSSIDHSAISQLIQKVNYSSPQIDYVGFQTILGTFQGIIRDATLLFLLEKRVFEDGRVDEYSRITHKLYFYLRDGFMGAVNFQLGSGKRIDESIRLSSEFVYNTLKYQLVKYLGIFNIMYRYSRSKSLQIPNDDVPGIDRLLTKLEYNAFSPAAKIASDYGVPYNVIRYFEDGDRSSLILDRYEERIKNKLNGLINGN